MMIDELRDLGLPEILFLSKLLEAMFEYTILINEFGTVLFANRFHLGSVEELYQVSLVEYVHGDLRSFFSKTIKSVILNKRSAVIQIVDIQGNNLFAKLAPMTKDIALFLYYFKNDQVPQQKTIDKSGHLSPVERQIDEFVSMGLPSKQIADKMGRSKHTIDNHRRNLKRKKSESMATPELL